MMSLSGQVRGGGFGTQASRTGLVGQDMLNVVVRDGIYDMSTITTVKRQTSNASQAVHGLAMP